MKKLALLTVNALVLACGTAAAADFPIKSPSYAPQDPWAGFYFGTYFGAGKGKADQTLRDTTTERQVTTSSTTTSTATSTFTDAESGSGALTGDVTGSTVDLFAGYNMMMGPSWLIGVQLEGTVFSDISFKPSGLETTTFNQTFTTTSGAATATSSTTVNTTATTETYDELHSMFNFVGRAGFLMSPNMLIYGLGGASIGNFVIPDSRDPTGGKRSLWQSGYTAGAGLEARLSSNWSLRAEYRYTHFNVDRDGATSSTQTQTSSAPTSTFTSTVATTRNTSTDVDFHMGKVGVVYQFCGSCGSVRAAY